MATATKSKKAKKIQPKTMAARVVHEDALKNERREFDLGLQVIREYKTLEGAENTVRAIRAADAAGKPHKEWASFMKDVEAVFPGLKPLISTAPGAEGLVIVDYSTDEKKGPWEVAFLVDTSPEDADPDANAAADEKAVADQLDGEQDARERADQVKDGTPISEDRPAPDTPAVKKTKSGVRISLWGFGGGEICRWMGKHGFTTAQATAALAGLGCPGVAPPTIRLNLSSGRQGIRGAIPELNAEQAKALLAFKE